MATHITPGQEYVACDRSGYRYRISPNQSDPNYVYCTDLADGSLRKVKPAALHTDPERHDGYLLASLVDAQWENHPVAQGGQYRAQTDRLRNRGTGTGTGK
ncbi:hypothetical protein [Streptomyces sp. NPDC007904]|jgi:hypothetical protein|uniref:hypothetical protein n=1 Tax=Streptomyces sp. NPDC007904 TaxID=3364787 RepID=UPI0036E6243B